jgi:putative endonuclease
LPDPRRGLGAAGERITATYLQSRGYHILDRNVRLRSGEIDIVAEHRGCLVFVEVRLRRGAGAEIALESVARRKQDRLRRLCNEYCARLSVAPECVRIDVVAVSIDRNGTLRDVILIENAVEDA